MSYNFCLKKRNGIYTKLSALVFCVYVTLFLLMHLDIIKGHSDMDVANGSAMQPHTHTERQFLSQRVLYAELLIIVTWYFEAMLPAIVLKMKFPSVIFEESRGR